MAYQIIAPPPDLKNYISHVWTLEHHTDDPSPKTFTVMSNGAPGLIFQQNPEAFTGFEGERLPQLFVFGQATKFGQLKSGGSYRTIGISFQPSALKSVFGLNANELTDHNADLDRLVKTSLSEQLLNANSTRQQLSALFTFLQTQTKVHSDENKKLNYATAALQEGRALPQVLHDLGLSERSLERLFLTHVGISPILYTRICRFQSSLVLMRQKAFRSLTDIAHSLGYFDQSHFIRDFKQFSGVSPSLYIRKAIERMPGFPEWQ